jgi:ubiquinone/menaquinone biosynthesis C-methylase UbiE
MSATAAVGVNYWPDTKCAKAFWSQANSPSYQELLRDTTAWLMPKAGERWLDLGCGSGQLTRSLWEKSGGTLAEAVALDYAAINERSITALREGLQPMPRPEHLHFVHGDFSTGLSLFADEHFDGIVSGLAIQYAESWDAVRGCWTTDAYDHLLREVYRILRPGGTFVFSVNVPEPAWIKVAWRSLSSLFHARRPLRYAKNAWRMLRYGAWLKREARRGRFHYLPVEVIGRKLTTAGLIQVEHRLSYAGQAYLLRCRRPD